MAVLITRCHNSTQYSLSSYTKACYKQVYWSTQAVVIFIEDIFGFENSNKENGEDYNVLERLFGKTHESDDNDASFQPLF